MTETLQQKIARVTKEHVAVLPYDPQWPALFEQEKNHLRACMPPDLLGRIEHFGSTSVPGLAAKPIVDMLIEVTSLQRAKTEIPPILEPQGYDYFWRPSFGDDTPPWYAWFIKRDKNGNRTHHLHMVEHDFEHWDRILFRDYLIDHPGTAGEYAELKRRLSSEHADDRIAYTREKTDFILRITEKAKNLYTRSNP